MTGAVRWASSSFVDEDEGGGVVDGNDDEDDRTDFFREKQLRSYKQRVSADESGNESEYYAMSEDVYAFIVAAPVFSVPFAFAIAIISIKYVIFACLLLDIIENRTQAIGGSDKSAILVKALLVPVAIAMQSDLMAVYETVANVRYCGSRALCVSKHATKRKHVLSYILRSIDGLASLLVNFGVMMQTDHVLGVLLNFAALHFLQDIDDTFYVLVEKGFFGDAMEDMTATCRMISFPKRDAAKSFRSHVVTQLDSILFFFTFAVLFSGFLTMSILSLRGDERFNTVQMPKTYSYDTQL